MTKENAEDFLPLVQAMVNGKTIQHLFNGEWNDISNPGFDDYLEYYRIKPEIEYVPFDTVEELIDCWNKKKFNGKPPYNADLEMPLIWIKSKDCKMNSFITNYDYSSDIVFIGYLELNLSDLFKYYTFLDGTPIGKIKE